MARPLRRIANFGVEAFPFLSYARIGRKLQDRVRSEDILHAPPYSSYLSLSDEAIEIRIKEEHERAVRLDEKTFRFTFLISVALAVVGSVLIGNVERLSVCPPAMILCVSLVGTGLVYSFASIVIAIHGSRTWPWYGYGSGFLLELRRSDTRHLYLASQLARQETMNDIRHVVNETAFICLRNGLMLLATGALVFLGFVAYQAL